ncbi:MAG: GGDEF domain-containing protein, partial [Candidatus Competibacteraceae bacterium]|nr:GGDEF domain-containing protein [Candidatus Competibacteraceae bacterium]
EISLTDELTKIYNRRGFYLLGEPILSEGRRLLMPLTILYFDLDGLKEVNDTLGHDTGSQLVLEFANLLRTTFRSSDVVARVGGDEFAVVARSRQADIMIALKRLDAAIEAANSTGEKPYQISYSVGEAASEPTADESFAELVARADAVMYERKRLKKAARASTAETDPGSRQPLPAATVQEPR